MRALALAALTFVAFLPALTAGTIWDDDYQVFANPFIQRADGLPHFWLTMSASDYYPVTSTVHWIEWRLWGDAPMGYHAVNVALHAASALVLWRVLTRLAVPVPFVVAACFAVHPVTVASVAWISELKNTLSMLLVVVALWAYLRFEDDGAERWYGVSLAMFVLALLAKTSVVALPVLLLLLAWHRRGRVGTTDVRRSLPFFALSLVLGLVTVYHQQHNGIGAVDARPESMLSRVAASGWVPWFYLITDLLPVRLSMIYPRWTVDPLRLPSWIPLLALAVLGVLAWRRRAAWGHAVLVALAAFTILLAPVLGLITMSFHRHSLVSDHLQYVALVVPVAFAVGGAAAWLRRVRAGRWTARGVAAAVLVLLATLTWQRARAFENERTLWTDTLAKNPRAWAAYDNLGYLLFDEGHYAEAARDHRAAVEIQPDAAEPHNNLGRALAALGRLDEAEAEYREAIRLEPGMAEPQNNLGLALAKQGRYADAGEHYAAALRLNPGYADADNNLGLLLAQQGRDHEAEERYHRALALRPDDVGVLSNLGNLLVHEGRPSDGEALFARAIRLQPRRAALHSNLGTALAAEGRHAEAVREYATALALEPRLLEAHYNIGNSLVELGRFDEAADHYREALRIDPGLLAAQQNLERLPQGRR